MNSIRKAEKEDIAAIEKINTVWPDGTIKTYFEQGRSGYVAVSDGTISGFILFEDRGNWTHVFLLQVSDKGHGIGRELMSIGHPKKSLHVRESNPARGFYEKLGFHVSHTKPYYYADCETALIMLNAEV